MLCAGRALESSGSAENENAERIGGSLWSIVELCEVLPVELLATHEASWPLLQRGALEARADPLTRAARRRTWRARVALPDPDPSSGSGSPVWGRYAMWGRRSGAQEALWVWHWAWLLRAGVEAACHHVLSASLRAGLRALGGLAWGLVRALPLLAWRAPCEKEHGWRWCARLAALQVL